MEFPFTKLDIIACPHFKYGGMENVGCITFSETMICKLPETMTLAERLYHFMIIAHEM